MMSNGGQSWVIMEHLWVALQKLFKGAKIQNRGASTIKISSTHIGSINN